MKNSIGLLTLLVFWNLSSAQDLVITNARIIDGAGAIIDNGSITVTAGRLASVAEGQPDSQSPVVIDAEGMTVVPGLIDTHLHLIGRYRADTIDGLERAIRTELPSKLQELLASGFTTVMSNGGYFPYILDVRRQLEAGELVGPRLLAVGPLFVAPGGRKCAVSRGALCNSLVHAEVSTPNGARDRVRELAHAGVDGIKVYYDTNFDGGPLLADDVLIALGAASEQMGLPLMVHTARGTPTETIMRLIEYGTDRFVHSGAISEIDAELLAAAMRRSGVSVSTTVYRPFRPNEPPEEQTAEYKLHQLQALRVFWDTGIIVAYGTDRSNIPTAENLLLETGELSRVLSSQEVLTALTRNAAAYLDMSDQIGTLEPGKIADIVIIDGDPIADITNLSKVSVVIQGGQIVVDNR